MKGSKITADDIFGSKSININTPIIILHNVSREYLIPTCNIGIFNVDIDKLQNDLEHRIQFIDRFVPIGQIQIKNNWKNNKNGFGGVTIPMANTRIIHVTNTFDEIAKNVWIGIIRKAGRESRTLGTIKTKGGSPKTTYPVFPSTFLNKLDNYNEDESNSNNDIYANIYSDDSYGRWVLNTYKFNVDKTHLKMIDSTGEMSNMYIPKPILPEDVLDVGYGDDNYDRKVYFTAQGLIVSDSNCVPPLDNMSKMTINECNGATVGNPVRRSVRRPVRRPVKRSMKQRSGTINNALYTDSIDLDSVRANDDDQLTLTLNEEVKYFNDSFATKSKRTSFPHGHSKEKKLILREKDEPWFSDAGIVGTAASISNPHKITGIIDGKTTIPLMSRDTIISQNELIDASNLGTISGDEKETQALYVSGCKSGNAAQGYSRYEQNQNCGRDNIENFTESFTENTVDTTNGNMDYINNYIMYALCFIIIILLFMYRKK